MAKLALVMDLLWFYTVHFVVGLGKDIYDIKVTLLRFVKNKKTSKICLIFDNNLHLYCSLCHIKSEGTEVVCSTSLFCSQQLKKRSVPSSIPPH